MLTLVLDDSTMALMKEVAGFPIVLYVNMVTVKDVKEPGRDVEGTVETWIPSQ